MKFFHEMKNNAHYDLQYGKIVNNDILLLTLKFLLEELSKICDKNDIKIIIMHGSLIGWYFNKSILPYDNDIDVCILEEDIIKFIKCDKLENDDYIIKVNPNFINRNPNDRDNVIDARIISKKCGLFIDITFLTSFENNNYFNCKSPHYYLKDYILPLKEDLFENCKIYIPNKYKYCLYQEYGPNVLSNTYKNWIFKDNLWIKTYL
jgi:phosphorylcholine metabolism protein LicD